MRMAQNLILLPVFGQVLLVAITMVVLGLRRSTSMKVQKKGPQDMGLAVDRDWERPAEVASRNFKNQFEIPILFYAVCAFALITRRVDIVLFTLAWVFVASRYAHTFFHLTSDNVMARAISFFAGFLSVAVMWVWFASQILIAGF